MGDFLDSTISNPFSLYCISFFNFTQIPYAFLCTYVPRHLEYFSEFYIHTWIGSGATQWVSFSIQYGCFFFPFIFLQKKKRIKNGDPFLQPSHFFYLIIKHERDTWCVYFLPISRHRFMYVLWISVIKIDFNQFIYR